MMEGCPAFAVSRIHQACVVGEFPLDLIQIAVCRRIVYVSDPIDVMFQPVCNKKIGDGIVSPIPGYRRKVLVSIADPGGVVVVIKEKPDHPLVPFTHGEVQRPGVLEFLLHQRRIGSMQTGHLTPLTGPCGGEHLPQLWIDVIGFDEIELSRTFFTFHGIPES